MQKFSVLLGAFIAFCPPVQAHRQIPQLDDRRINAYAAEIKFAVRKKVVLRTGFIAGLIGCIVAIMYKRDRDDQQEQKYHADMVKKVDALVQSDNPDDKTELELLRVNWEWQAARNSEELLPLQNKTSRLIDCFWREATLREIVRTTMVTFFISALTPKIIKTLGISFEGRSIKKKGPYTSIREYARQVLCLPEATQSAQRFIRYQPRSSENQECFLTTLHLIHDHLEHLLGYMTYRLQCFPPQHREKAHVMNCIKANLSQAVTMCYLQIEKFRSEENGNVKDLSNGYEACITALQESIEHAIASFAFYEVMVG